MAWYDDVWNWTKGAVKDVADVAKNVAPLLPLILKKGGNVGEFKDTPQNRKKLLKLFNKLHKSNVPYSHLQKMKKGGELKMELEREHARTPDILPFKRGRGRPKKK